MTEPQIPEIKRVGSLALPGRPSARGRPRLGANRTLSLLPIGTTIAPLKRPPAQGAGVPPGPPSAPRRDARARLPPFFSLRYKLIEPINEGGMGYVYRARDTILDMDVALKFLPPAMNRDPVAVAELKREAVLAMRLSHKNIVRLHNIERENNRLFIVMEYVAGETLREVLQRMGPLSMASVAAIARACAVALDYAHGQHILHRDIKPENLMVDRDGQLKIVDFGIAVRVQSAPGVTVEGTPGYMSPEQLRHETPDARADVFSLGAVLCELLTGKRVFPDRGDLKRLFEFPPAGLADVPPPVRDVLARALDLDRERRWSSVREFYAALEQALTR